MARIHCKIYILLYTLNTYSRGGYGKDPLYNVYSTVQYTPYCTHCTHIAEVDMRRIHHPTPLPAPPCVQCTLYSVQYKVLSVQLQCSVRNAI